MSIDHTAFDTEQLDLYRIIVRENATEEHIARARNGGDPRAQQAPCTAFGHSQPKISLATEIQHDSGEVDRAFSVGEPADHFSKLPYASLQALVRLRLWNPSDGKPDVHAFNTGQKRRSQTVHGAAQTAKKISQRRLGDSRCAERPRHDNCRSPFPRRTAPIQSRRQPGNQLLRSHFPHLARHTRQHGYPTATRILEPDPGGAAVPVRDDVSPVRDHRLGKVGFGDRPPSPHPGPSLMERLYDRFVTTHLAPKERGNGRLRHVIAGGTESTRGYDPVAPLEGLANGRGNGFRRIADSRAANNLHANRGQLPGEVSRIRVDGKAEEQLVADGDDFDLHRLSR